MIGCRSTLLGSSVKCNNTLPPILIAIPPIILAVVDRTPWGLIFTIQYCCSCQCNALGCMSACYRRVSLVYSNLLYASHVYLCHAHHRRYHLLPRFIDKTKSCLLLSRPLCALLISFIQKEVGSKITQLPQFKPPHYS